MQQDELSSSSSSSSCVVEAFSALLRFGVDNNKPSVLRAIVGRLTVHGRRSPGGCGCLRLLHLLFLFFFYNSMLLEN